VQAGGGEISAGELTLIARINANATATTDSFGFVGSSLLAATARAAAGTSGGRLDPPALQTLVRSAIDDLAGQGWFVDRTPGVNEEFRAVAPGGALHAIDSRAVDRIDLMTVVAHELGHLAGLPDSDAVAGNLMSSTLPAGVRRTTWSAGVDTVFQGGGL